MHYKMERTGDAGTLILGGELTLQAANELKEVLIKTLEADNDVILDLEDVVEVDLSCLQLLCSAHRTAMMANKRLSLNWAGSKVFQRVMEESGYSRHIGCSLDRKRSCLWVKGGKDVQDHHDRG